MKLSDVERAALLKGLQLLAEAAERYDEPLWKLALDLRAAAPNRATAMQVFVVEAHRRFVYAPDPIRQEYVPSKPPFEAGSAVEVEDVCVFVAACALAIGIPCRFVVACWCGFPRVLFLAYENDEGRWTALHPLHKSGQVEELIPIDELVTRDLPDLDVLEWRIGRALRDDEDLSRLRFVGSTIDRALRQLHKKGAVRFIDRHWYVQPVVTQLGREALERPPVLRGDR